MITVHMIGNAHLDPVWLWRWPAGVGEALATCRSACDLLDDEPDVVFTRGDAWLYERIEALDPVLFARIRAHVAAGRWAVVGGWYIQPDCNLPLAASFRKHREIGRRHAREKLGIDVTVGYNVDSFGHTAALPRLLREGGYDSYVMMRPMAHERTLPAALFRWRTPGDDGPGIVTWRLPLAYCTPDDDLTRQVEAAITCVVPGVDHVMCFYGVGDHGGGPTRRQTAWIRAHRDAFPGARLVFSHPRAFFDAIMPHAATLPEVTGELQMHAIGCYAVVRDIKSGMRRAEHALLAAEAGAAAFPANAPRDAATRLDAAWRLALFNQFHDVYGGTSLAEACEDARDQLGAARSAAESVLYDTLFRNAVELPGDLHQRVVAFNPSGRDFDGCIRWEPWVGGRAFEGWIADADGRPVPLQVLPAGAVTGGAFSLLWPARIAPRSLAIFTLRSGKPPAPVAATTAASAEAAPAVSGAALVGSGWTATRGAGRDLLHFNGVPLESIRVEVREDPSDTWSHGIDRFAGPVAGCFSVSSVHVEEAGPVRFALRLEAEFGASTLELSVRAYAGDPRLELVLSMDWRERLRVAKLVLTFATSVARRTDGIQEMGLDRAQDGREYPLIDWSVAHADAGAVGVACPDCCAISGEGREMAFTLLRSPVFAWHDPAVLEPHRAYRYTDQGGHRFRFAIRAGADAVRCEADAAAFHLPPACLDWTKGMLP
jgi:alpha-mannosidase